MARAYRLVMSLGEPGLSTISAARHAAFRNCSTSCPPHRGAHPGAGRPGADAPVRDAIRLQPGEIRDDGNHRSASKKRWWTYWKTGARESETADSAAGVRSHESPAPCLCRLTLEYYHRSDSCLERSSQVLRAGRSYLAEFLLEKKCEVIGLVADNTVNLSVSAIFRTRSDRVRRHADETSSFASSTVPPGRGLQPRRAELRAGVGGSPSYGEVTALGVTRLLDAIRMVDRENKIASTRHPARRCSRCAGAADREHPLPAQPVRWRRSTATDHRELPRATACTRRAASCSAAARAGAKVRHP